MSASRILVLANTIVLSAPFLNGIEAASLRVDDTTLVVPSVFSSDWQEIRQRTAWTKASGESVGKSARFSRFLAREYEVSSSSAGLRVKTSWFAKGSCLSTNQNVSELSQTKRTALETSLKSSLQEVQQRLESAGSVGSERVISIWAQFRSEPTASIPIEGLSTDDQELLEPFVSLAQESFESRLFANSSCSEGDDPASAREAVRSDGRRMESNRPATQSGMGRRMPQRSRSSSEFGPTGEAGPSENPTTEQDDNEESNEAKKEKLAFLISKYEARAGSLTFEFAGDFVRCIRARNPRSALAQIRAAYRNVVSAGNGKRVAYHVVEIPSSECNDNEFDTLDSTPSLPGNFNPPPEDRSTEGASGSDGAVDTEPFEPFPDPLDTNTDSGRDGFGDFDLDPLDLESIPTPEFDELTDGATLEVPDESVSADLTPAAPDSSDAE